MLLYLLACGSPGRQVLESNDQICHLDESPYSCRCVTSDAYPKDDPSIVARIEVCTYWGDSPTRPDTADIPEVECQKYGVEEITEEQDGRIRIYQTVMPPGYAIRTYQGCPY